MKQCKWCKEFFDTADKPNGFMANHTRWCDKNPKKQKYLDDLKKRDTVKLMAEARKKSGVTNQFSKAKLEGKVVEHSLKGKKHPNPFKSHTPETIEVIRQKALESNHRRLRKGMVEYKGVMLDSSWELALAMRLDELQIKWERPEPLKWVDKDGNEHNYFPDFYLEEYDLYLDPKNPAAYQNQKEKVEVLKDTYKNLRFILTLKECEEFEIRK
jgi:hypothetical protein